MIPKIIHYCWFGRGPKSAETLSFIEGWRRTNPGFRVIEWNEDNFDINVCKYVRQAYEARKFAFVSDYARGYALWKMGGVYLDTDVELVGQLDCLLAGEGFLGFEHGDSVATSTMGFCPRHPLIGRYLNQYHERSFILSEGVMDLTTNVVVMTKLAQEMGLKLNGKHQILAEGVTCLPMVYLSPLDYVNHIDHRTRDTIAIHHYSHSWGSAPQRIKKNLTRLLSAFFGGKPLRFSRSMTQLFRRP